MSDLKNFYGCFNRKPFKSFYLVKGSTDYPTREAVPMGVTAVPFNGSLNCHYTHSEAGRVDPKCGWCKWRAVE